MVFEWLHMPKENGYNRRRHLSRTPPEFWSRHDKMYAGLERSKYFRARNKEYRRHGGTKMAESAQRRFHARFPGGDGYYFPYAEALESPYKEHFRDVVDDDRHGYQFWQDFVDGQYGDPDVLRELWKHYVWNMGWDTDALKDLDLLMSFVELLTGEGVEGPLGWNVRGDRMNQIERDEGRDPWVFNRNGHPNGPFHSGMWEQWRRG